MLDGDFWAADSFSSTQPQSDLLLALLRRFDAILVHDDLYGLAGVLVVIQLYNLAPHLFHFAVPEHELQLPQRDPRVTPFDNPYPNHCKGCCVIADDPELAKALVVCEGVPITRGTG